MLLSSLVTRLPAGPPVLAAFRVADAVSIALLLLFVLWGMHRGVLRQVLSLAVVGASIGVASWLGPQVEGTVAKVASLSLVEREAAAWVAVLFAALVTGAVVLSFACCRLPERKGGGLQQFGAALLGGALGGLVLLVAGYALLGVGSGAAAPPLARPSAPVEASDGGSAWIARLRGSLTSEAMARGADTLGRWVEVPVWLETRRKGLDRALRVDTTLERRPRER